MTGETAGIYRHLGAYSDWVAAAGAGRPLLPHAPPGPETRRRVRDALAFGDGDETARDVRIEGRWERDGVAGEHVSWSVGYGPRTQAWVLRPAGVAAALPGVVALHGHDGFKYFGKEKIADGPDAAAPVVAEMRERMYGGRAFANLLAREGFVVLVHDVFLWGSRRFPLAEMPERTLRLAAATRETPRRADAPGDDTGRASEEYNAAASHHEHVAAKYCAVLGTTLAGVVSHEDRVAVGYLRSRPDVIAGGVGCVGLSGGGCRAALLHATCDAVAASVVVGMMSTYAGLLDHNVEGHTWMFFPDGWARHGDWPDLAACRAPAPLLVQYDRDDRLFTPGGMQAAHARLAAHYASVGQPDAYTGEFYPGPHKFDAAMQASAFAWLRRHLGGGEKVG